MNPALKSRINRMLGAAGLGQLDDPGLFSQMAFLIRDHERFRSLLIACEPERRTEMFNAMAPNLRFEARTLDEYLTEAREDAEARQLPLQQPDGTLKQFEVPEINTALDPPAGETATE